MDFSFYKTTMKKYICYLCLFYFLILSNNLNAQKVYERRGQTVYLEMIGSGFIYSLNYESRFSQKTGGLGGRVGFSYVSDWFAVPVNVNYLLSKKKEKHFLEIGAGFTYFKYNEPQLFGGEMIDSQVMPAITFMYRYHPRYGKFLLRFGMTPLYGYLDEGDTEKIFFPLFGLSLGKVF